MATCNLCGVKMDGGCAARGCPHKAAYYYPYTLLPPVANPLHPAPEVEDLPRDAQPARLTLGEP